MKKLYQPGDSETVSEDLNGSTWFPVLTKTGVLILILFMLFVSVCVLVLNSWVLSDIRLKRNIILIGQSQSNLNIYEYNYVWSNKKYRGAMAQDLLKSNPEAVTKLFGYYLVNYNKIDVDFEWVSNS